MLSIWMVSLLFFAVGTVVLSSGIFTLQSNHKASANRVFFALTMAIAIWSSGMGMSTILDDASTSEIFRRFSAIGWSTAYSIFLHFVIIITDKAELFKKRWFFLWLYLPSLFSIFAFTVPNRLNPNPYNLHRTDYGWINAAANNIWDCLFYVYYISFTLIGLLLLYRWGKNSSDNTVKKKSRFLCTSIFSALVLGTFTDVFLSSVFSVLPQLAPVILLIPTLSVFHILQKDRFGITEGVDKKTSYMIIFVSAFIYIILSFVLIYLPDTCFAPDPAVFHTPLIRGIIVQIQLLISIYLVLRGNRPGYIVSVMMNSVNLSNSIVVLFLKASMESLPGIVSYSGVLAIVTMIIKYKEKNAAYIQKINTQAIREQFYSSIFKQAPVGIAIMRDTSFTRNEEFEGININPMYEKILGWTRDELQKKTWTDMTHPDDLAEDMVYFEQFREGKIGYYSMEKRYLKPDGSTVWVDMIISRFSRLNEKSVDHVCIISDITKRKEIEAELKYNNEHDVLTGLYNRTVLEKMLERDALTYSAGKRALISIDLTAMHIFSLRYGFNYSQNMLKKLADSLKLFCTENYQLFSTYENRFVFYVKGYQDKYELTDFCEAISNILNSHLRIHGINGGIGVIEIDESNMGSTSELLKMLLITSEIAAKNKSRNYSVSFYGPEIETQAIRENGISRELTEICEGTGTERLYMHFQPIIDIVSNQVCGFEALARLSNEKYGMIPPMEFIEIAEKSNMIIPLGEIIIKKALHFSGRLKENGYETITVTINVSMIQMLENDFANKLLSMIKIVGLNPMNIGIELTETVFTVELEEVNRLINILRSAGIRIMIDDFGTGYSSYAREIELNIDCIKIDKSFIDGLLVTKPEETITGDLISMAHKLGHCVIAEGIEDERQLNYLRDFGCDRAQGYLFSKSLDEDAAFEFLERQARIF